MSNKYKADGIGIIAKGSVVTIEMGEIRTSNPMVILRKKGRGIFPRNLLIRVAEYENTRNCTVLHTNKIKRVER